jgi:hypothetical protein
MGSDDTRMDHDVSPPHDNFDNQLVQVFRGPYDFSIPGAASDFELQTTVGSRDSAVG